MKVVSELLSDLIEQVEKESDTAISKLEYVLPQYITGHNDNSAYKEIDRTINAPARAWQHIVATLRASETKVRKAENSVDNLYG